MLWSTVVKPISFFLYRLKKSLFYTVRNVPVISAVPRCSLHHSTGQNLMKNSPQQLQNSPPKTSIQHLAALWNLS